MESVTVTGLDEVQCDRCGQPAVTFGDGGWLCPKHAAPQHQFIEVSYAKAA